MRFINLRLTTHTSCNLCMQLMSYIRTSLNLLFIFVRLPSSLGRIHHCQQACSVLRLVYLVIPQAGTRFQQTYSVSRRISLLHPQRLALHLLIFSIRLLYSRILGNSSENNFFLLFSIGMVFMLEDDFPLYYLVIVPL
jgi:hypothetical protein